MQSERSDEEAVSRRRAASCICVQGLAACQHRGELLLYPLFYSSIFSPMFFSTFLSLSSPLFLGPSSSFALWLSVLAPWFLRHFSLLLICVFAAAELESQGGHFVHFPKNVAKKRVPSPGEGVKSAWWDVGCVYGYDCTWPGECSCLCI